MKTVIKHILLLLTLLAILQACSPNEAATNETSESVVVVRTQTVTKQAVKRPVVTSGILASKEEVKLSFKTGGVIARILVDEGQTVRKGQLLASLNLTEVSSQVNQAQQQYDKAQRDLKRTQNLFADSAATMEQVENATTGVEVASAALQATTFNRQYSTIYAPDDGRILKRSGEAGEITSPGDQVFVFAADGKQQWIVRTGVADRDMVRLALGDTATVQFDAYPGVAFMAMVTEIAQIADPQKGTFEVELRVQPQGKKLASGLVATLTILPSQTFSSLMIPIEALIEADGNNGYVYTLNKDGKTVKKVPVQLAGIFDTYVGISDGLAANATIITEGNNYLTADAKVKVVNTRPDAGGRK